MSGVVPLRAVGVRRKYAEIPAAVRAWVEEQLGARVAAAVTQPGGMSPGCAARLLLDDGSPAFVRLSGASSIR